MASRREAGLVYFKRLIRTSRLLSSARALFPSPAQLPAWPFSGFQKVEGKQTIGNIQFSTAAAFSGGRADVFCKKAG